MEQFVLDSVHRALATDSSPLSHPIVPPATFGPFFDRITYQKVRLDVNISLDMILLLILYLVKYFVFPVRR